MDFAVAATMRLLAPSLEYDRNGCADVVQSFLCSYAYPACSDDDRKSSSSVVATSRSDQTTTSRSRRQRRPTVNRVCREDCEVLQGSVCQQTFHVIARSQLTGMVDLHP